MPESVKHSDIRFFSNSSIFESSTEKANANLKEIDPIPFGLDLEEPYPPMLNNSEQRLTMNQCPTSTPVGSDNGVDVDWEFD